MSETPPPASGVDSNDEKMNLPRMSSVDTLPSSSRLGSPSKNDLELSSDSVSISEPPLKKKMTEHTDEEVLVAVHMNIPAKHKPKYKAYKSRWLMLGIFGLIGWINAVTWISYASVKSKTNEYYNVSDFDVNFLVLIYAIGYVPGTPLASWIYLRWNLRAGVVVGAFLTALGNWIRMFSMDSFGPDAQASNNGYIYLVIGQSFAALGQPFFTNAAAKIAGEWFPPKERSKATSIGALFNPIGILFAQVTPPRIVTRNREGDVVGMFTLQLLITVVASFGLFMALAFFESRPPTPPSRSKEEEWKRVDVNIQHGASWRDSEDLTRNRYSKEVRLQLYELVTNFNFVLLFLSFTMGLSLFNGVMTNMESLAASNGYSDDTAGLFGGAMIIFGLGGSTVAGIYMDTTHNYNKALKVAYVTTLAVNILGGLLLGPNNKWLVFSMFALAGFTTVPILPISFECAAEATYPVSEDVSGGLLNIGGNLMGFATITIMDGLIDKRGKRDAAQPVIIFLWAWLTVATLIALSYNGDRRRWNADRSVEIKRKHAIRKRRQAKKARKMAMKEKARRERLARKRGEKKAWVELDGTVKRDSVEIPVNHVVLGR